jgi:hypothetical protein
MSISVTRRSYVPVFDAVPAERIGWYAGRVERVGEMRADDRFRGT